MTCDMKFTKDADGRELLLKDGKFQVMMEWEKPYMEACIDALSPKGDVLEIGFGLGYSAAHIQKYKPKSHTIIEYHPTVAARARKWASGHRNVTVIEDTWQKALPQLGEFDEVFFDDYPLESESEMQTMKREGSAANRALQVGRDKLAWVGRKFPSLSERKYDDEAVGEFFALLREKERAEPQVYLRFFSDLEKRGQITKQQEKKAQERLLKEELISPRDLDDASSEKACSFRAPSERLLVCLSLCLTSHMRRDARFSCYLNHDVSLYDHPDFLEKVINNPYLDFKRTLISVDVPKECDYFSGSRAQVVVIRKASLQIS